MQDKRSGLLGFMARVDVLIQQGVYTLLGGVNKSLGAANRHATAPIIHTGPSTCSLGHSVNSILLMASH